MAVREVRIDYTINGESAPRMSAREGTQVMLCLGGTKLAEAVVQGDMICVAQVKGTVDEVGRTEINDDGSANTRTILSP